MNRIDLLFQQKKKNILSIYFTAGFPGINDTTTIIRLLEQYGADMIEIGVPFSDPVADGPVIQESNRQSLINGMSLSLLINQLKNIRPQVKIPLVLMGYFNPFLQYGMESLVKDLALCGIDGMIIPDLPPEYYEEHYQELFQTSGLHNILLVTPGTSISRVQYLDQLSSGFLYLVSSAATTGGKLTLDQTKKAYFSRIAGIKTKNPLLIGFGISDKKSLDSACHHASGGIIGSAFIRALNNPAKGPEKNIAAFMKSFR